MECPLCGTSKSSTFRVFTQERGAVGAVPAHHCSTCGLVYLADYKVDRTHLYDGDYGAWGGNDVDLERAVAGAKRQAFRLQLRYLSSFRTEGQNKLLDVGTGNGYMLDVAEELGYQAYGLELSAEAAAKASLRHPGKVGVGTLEDVAYADASFDVVTLTDIVEHISDPIRFFGDVARILRPGGLVFIITPNADAITRKLLGPRWFQYKHEHVIYWSPSTLAKLYERFGFKTLLVRHNTKAFTLSYYQEYFQKYSFLSPLDRVFLSLYRVLPAGLKDTPITNPITGEMLAIAKKG